MRPCGKEIPLAHKFIPIIIIVILGAFIARVYHARYARFWIASLLSAASTGIVWVLGTAVFISIVSATEGWRGLSDLPYALKAFAASSLVALVPSLLVGNVYRQARISTSMMCERDK